MPQSRHMVLIRARYAIVCENSSEVLKYWLSNHRAIFQGQVWALHIAIKEQNIFYPRPPLHINCLINIQWLNHYQGLISFYTSCVQKLETKASWIDLPRSEQLLAKMWQGLSFLYSLNAKIWFSLTSPF